MAGERESLRDWHRLFGLLLAGAPARQGLTPAVEARAAELEAAGCRPLDALHLAAAEAAGADFFCTCDDRLLRRARAMAALPLRAVSPIELVGELGLRAHRPPHRCR